MEIWTYCLIGNHVHILAACVSWVKRSAPNKINEDGSAMLDPSYVCFLREEDKEIETLIRKVTLTGRPLGAERFIKRLEKMLERDVLLKKAGRPKEKK